MTGYSEVRPRRVKTMVNGQHFRTDPNYKNVFFWDPDGLGTGNFGVSGFDLHTVKEGECLRSKKSQTSRLPIPLLAAL